MVALFGEGREVAPASTREHFVRHGCPLLVGDRDVILRYNIRTPALATTTVAPTPWRQEEQSI
jgi:hypothetical protein